MIIEYDKLLLCALIMLNEKTGRRSITEMEFKNFCGILRLKEGIKVKFITEDNGELLRYYFDMVSLLDIGPSAYRLKLPISLEEVKEEIFKIMNKDLIEKIRKDTVNEWYLLTLEEENLIPKFKNLDLKYKIIERDKRLTNSSMLARKLIKR